MNERDQILGRIRQALKTPAHRPAANGHAAPGARAETVTDFQRFLPAHGDSWDTNVALFQKNAVALKAEFFLVKDWPELTARLAALCAAEGWKKIASHHGPLTDAACQALDLPVCRTDPGYPIPDLEVCDAGITECDALIAQTGSVLVTSRSAGGRALSVLPPHHVVLARREQLLPSLPEAFALIKKKYAPDYPSLISFITGPSRTGDIERILVLGAHGPKKLTIFCL